MAGYTDRTEPLHEDTGQCIKPGPPVERTLVSSVAELMKDAPAARDAPERVEWLAFLDSDLGRPSLAPLLGHEPPLVLALGLARGYQIWALLVPPASPCDPSPSEWGAGKDKWAEQRPVVGVVDSISAVAGRLHSTLNLVSLATGHSLHSLTFDDPISAFQASDKYIVVIFPGRFCVYDAGNFAELFWINGTPVDLSSSWIAFADSKLCGALQSCGGVHSSDTMPAYATHVINAAKNLRQTVSSISESLGGRSQGPANPAIVTIIHTPKWTPTQTDIHSASRKSDPSSVLLHFPALKDEPVCWLRFSHSSQLLVAAGASGQALNLFAILPHPSGSSIAAAQHLYTLFRGTTPASILHIAFSPDSRWLGISTNHGTTHVFPITSYGGSITLRTHGAGPVNKESRFHRSAGVERMMEESPPSSTPPKGSPSSPKGSPLARDTHPLIKQAGGLWKVSGNPRLPPFPPPTLVQAAGKVYQQLLPGGVGTWAGELGEGLKGKRRSGAQDSAPLAATGSLAFATPRTAHDWTRTSLFLVSENGELWEYGMEVRATPVGTAKGPKETPDSAIALTLQPSAMWTLHRTKSSPDLRAPLGKNNLLRQAAKALGPKQPPSPRTPPPQTNATDWISHVEMVTYQGPSRRLWMGPQFTFRTIVESVPSRPAPAAPEDSPRPPSRSGSGKKGKKRNRKDNNPTPPSSTPPSSTPPLANKIDRSAPMPIRGNLSRMVPVVLESGCGSYEPGAEVTLEVCGSWSDADHVGGDEAEGRLRESIADAMKTAPVIHSLRTRGGSSAGDSDMEDARDSFSDTDSNLLHALEP